MMLDKDILSLVNNYINGEDLEESLVEELENNPNFMLRVIFQTNDKKMYDFCSDSVKVNFNFVKSIINKFNQDEDFIIMVAEEFLSKVTNESEEIQMILLVEKYLKTYQNKIKYGFKRVGFFSEGLVRCNQIVNMINDSKVKQTLGMGFIYILESFGEHKNIVDMFAEQFLKEIFYKNKMSIEILLHQYFNSIDKIQAYGVSRFIVDYITLKDSYLASYVQINNCLLQNLLDEGYKALNNWDVYENNLNMVRIDKVYDFAEAYLDDHPNISLTEIDAIFYLIKNTEYYSIFVKCAQEKGKIFGYDIDFSELPIDYLDLKFTIEEQAFLSDLNAYIIKIFEMKSIKDLDVESYEEKQGQVIQVNFSGNKKV